MFKKQTHIHFLGIGGIGMSGIAEILKRQGHTVSGCDLEKNSKVISRLKNIGCTIYEKHDHSHTENIDVLVCTTAIDKNNPEVAAAIKKGIPVIPRALMLAEIMRSKDNIAICGSHGKTTTSSLISHMLIEIGLDPTIIVGGILKNISSNARVGKSNLLVAEADESYRSFLYLNPTIAILTNNDLEHLETYKNIDDIKKTFKTFLSQLPFYGKAIVCIDNPHVQSILPFTHVPTIKYGFSSNADIKAEILEIGPTYSIFNAHSQNTCLEKVKLNIPGKHNVQNCLAAIAICLEFKIPQEQIKKSIETFNGTERRFEYKGKYKNTEIYDDYGHHPTEIKNALITAQNTKQNKLHVIFQPHRFSRTQKLWDDFVNTFADSKIYHLYLTEIYSASEKPIEGINSKRLAKEIQLKNPNLKVSFFSTYDEITQNIKKTLGGSDILLTLGAGKVNEIAEALVTL